MNTMRHHSIFDPSTFDWRVDVIGAGSIGSRTTIELAKLGLKNIHVHDFDVVESHNIANQAYGVGDIGKLKVEALREIIKRDCDLDITVHTEAVDSKTQLGKVVFLLTDSMSSRKEIWGGIKNKLDKALMIEARMGALEGRVYTINPILDTKLWESEWYEDTEAEVSACGSPISVGSTAAITSGLIVIQFIKWWSNHLGTNTVPVEKTFIFHLNPIQII